MTQTTVGLYPAENEVGLVDDDRDDDDPLSSVSNVLFL